MYQEVADGLDAADALPLRGPGGWFYVRSRIGAWRALLDRPLTSYYLVLGITILLLVLGLVMVESTASVFDLSHGLSAYSDFSKQLLGAAILGTGGDEAIHGILDATTLRRSVPIHPTVSEVIPTVLGDLVVGV